MVLLAGNEAWLKVIGRNNYVGARNDYRVACDLLSYYTPRVDWARKGKPKSFDCTSGCSGLRRGGFSPVGGARFGRWW